MENLYQALNEIFANRELISPERFENAAFALLLALVAGFITGPRAHSATPAFWRLVDISFGKIAERLDNIKRPAADLLLRGFFISLFMILFFGAIGIYIENTLYSTIEYLQTFKRISEILLVSLCLSAGAIIHHGMRLFQVMKGVKMSEGTYLTLARTSRMDLSAKDDFTLTRTATEIIIRLYDKACIAPLIWYILGGMPLLFIYASLAALSWKAGYDGTYDNVGKMPLMLEKLMGFIPTAFAASLLAMTTLIVPYSKPLEGLKPLLASNKYPYENGGAVISMIAHTLNIGVGGDATHLNGRKMKRNWTEAPNATAQLKAEHLKRVLYMVFVAYIYMIGALFGGSLWAAINF